MATEAAADVETTADSAAAVGVELTADGAAAVALPSRHRPSAAAKPGAWPALAKPGGRPPLATPGARSPLAPGAADRPPVRAAGGARRPPAPDKAGARSPSKEAAVKELFDCFGRRDVESALALLHPAVVFQPVTAEVTRAGEPYRGHDGIRRYFEDVETHWSRLVVNPTQIRAAGRAVVALGLVSGCGPAGSFADVPTTWVMKFTDGLVSHAQIFSDARHVAQALGDGARA